MAVSFTNSAYAQSASGTAVTADWSGTVVGGASFTATAGRLLVICLAAPGSSTTFSGEDSGWTRISDAEGTRGWSPVWYYKVAAGGETGFSLTASVTTTTSWYVLELDGLASSSVLDQSEENETYIGTGSTKSLSSGTTATLGVSDGFAISLFSCDVANYWDSNRSLSESFTEHGYYDAGVQPGVGFAYKQLSSSAGAEVTWTTTDTGDRVYSAIAVFKQASGGATTYTATASLSAAIQQAQAATASLQAAIQAPQFVTASADAAIAQARTASADLQAAIQQARTATTSADAAIVAAMSLEASLDAYIQALAERYARPDADVSDGDWLPSTPGDLYAMLDEETASDTDYIYTETASTCVIRLSDVADPGTSTGHVIRFKVPSGFTPQGNLRVVLKQGATEIAEAHNGTVSAGTLYEYTLTGTQADAITDYTNLTVTLEAQA